MNLSDIRREYNSAGLRRADLEKNPIAQFQKWFDDAKIALEKNFLDVNAMTLATADKNGKVSSRVVLLKGLDARGFVFYTNYNSRKGRELAQNKNAALNFFWPELERQVCVAGTVKKVSRAESEKYFQSRPRASQLAAWASDQSSVLEDRGALEKKWGGLEKQFSGKIPLPKSWGGFVVKPERIEFWQGRTGRLHDRFQYSRQKNGGWKIERLAP